MPDPWPRGRSLHGGVDEIPLPPPAAGRLWLAGKRYVGPDPAEAMASVGASVVVCLCEAFEIEDRYPGYVEWLETSGAMWWPIPDFDAPPLDSALSLVAEVAARLSAGTGVMVHCGAGMGRSGTVAAALLIHLGVPLDEALATVAESRPGAGPEVGAQKDLLARMSEGG